MRITASKNIDVDVEIDVQMEDVLDEFAERAREATPERWRRFGPCLSQITKILAAVKTEVIAELPAEGKKTMARLLRAQAKRYD